MKCPKCNNDYNNNEKFCKYCGTDLKKETNEEEKYLEAYVGNNYESFKRDTFNVGAFLLGPLYLLYRKMYLYAFVFFILSFLVSFCLPIILNLVLAFVINGIYLEKVKEDVRNIKRTNSGMSEEALLDKCRQKGGTNIGLPIAITIIFIALFVLLVVGVVFLVINAEEDYPDYERKEEIELKYDVPVGFEKRSNDYYASNDDEHFCFISVYEKSSYTSLSEEEYFKSRAGNSDLMSTNINGHTWYYFVNRDSDDSMRYKYMIIKGKREFEVGYDIYRDSDKFCSNNLTTFINSLKIVEKNGLEA